MILTSPTHKNCTTDFITMYNNKTVNNNSEKLQRLRQAFLICHYSNIFFCTSF